MANIEEQLKKMGLYDRYKKIQSQTQPTLANQQAKTTTQSDADTRASLMGETPDLTSIGAGVQDVANKTQNLIDRVNTEGITVSKQAQSIGAYQPLTDAGKDYSTYYNLVYGKSPSYSEILTSYRDFGLDKEYGQFTGSATQWKALLQSQKQSDIASQNVGKQEGNPPGFENQPITDLGQGSGQIGQGSAMTGGNITDDSYTKPNVEDFKGVFDSLVEDIGTTDIASIIGDVSSGDITTPELELSKEDRDAALEQIKTNAAQSLQIIQQNLAKRGLTFSGIRTQAEADLAADTLAKESGINRAFAGRLINAARQEQSRRETAIQAAENNWQKALQASGYIYNPYTDTLEKTLQREQFEYGQQQDYLESLQPEKPERPQIFGTSETGYYQQYYNAGTGKWEISQLTKGLIKTGEDSSDIAPKPISKNEFKDLAEAEYSMSITPSFLDSLYQEYLDEFNKGVNGPQFNDNQLLQLEQAGLFNASRQQQLDYLFGDGKTNGITNPFK